PMGWSLKNASKASLLRAAAAVERGPAPGQMTLTTIPSRPHSLAAVRLTARIASFEALYAPNPWKPTIPIDEAKLTMRPQPCAFICGYTACIAQTVPFTPEA